MRGTSYKKKINAKHLLQISLAEKKGNNFHLFDIHSLLLNLHKSDVKLCYKLSFRKYVCIYIYMYTHIFTKAAKNAYGRINSYTYLTYIKD